MKIPTKKLKNGFEMPVFGFGTWGVGGKFERDPGNDDQSDITAIKTAIELGITHLDTAEAYADGHAEELVGKAVKGYTRSKLMLVSKVSPWHMSSQELPNSLRLSLERLGTDYLDVYLLHRHNPQIPLEQTLAALDKLVAEGLVKNIGVCNFLPKFLSKAQSLTKNKIVYSQDHYNLEFREPESSGLVKYCQDQDIFLVAWRPVEKGNLQKAPILLEMAKKYGKTPNQIAINWLISQDHVVTLSKSRNIEHLKENLGAIGWEMEESDIERLRSEFPDQKFVSDSVPLG